MTRKVGAQQTGAGRDERAREKAGLHRSSQSGAEVVCCAEVLFGENTLFFKFKSSYSLERFKKKTILEVASFLSASFSSVTHQEISLDEYREFRFYLVDRHGRRVSLARKDSQFSSILFFFDYKPVVTIELDSTMSSD